MADIPIFLLAAGSSSRMGQPKQLLPWGEQTLIEFQVEKLVTGGNPVYVVLGSSSEQIFPLLKKYPVNVVINPDWEKGMGTSVAAGIKQVLTDLPTTRAVIYTLIDQPLVTITYLQKIVDTFTSGQKQIIASLSENDWLGVPALFDACYFPELQQLNGVQGAKMLIKKYASKVISVEAGDILEDMDTIESYNRLLMKSSRQNLSY